MNKIKLFFIILIGLLIFLIFAFFLAIYNPNLSIFKMLSIFFGKKEWGGEFSGNVYFSVSIIIMTTLILILFILISMFFLEKKEILIILISGFVVILWEIFIETIGWYFNLWDFAEGETNIIVVFQYGLYTGVYFLPQYYIYGFIFIKILHIEDRRTKIFLLILIYSIITIFGWIMDILIMEFTTYLLTMLVWMILNFLFLGTLILLYKYLIINKKEWDITIKRV